MSETTYHQRNREKDYYENNKVILRERVKIKYRELVEEKNIKRVYKKKIS